MSQQIKLGLDAYQDAAQRTDRLAAGLHRPLLGLFGETGGLLSELKKQIRGEDAKARFSDASREELGDVLWYFSTLCTRAGFRLSDVASVGRGQTVTFDDLEIGEAAPPLAETEYETRLFRLAGRVGALLERASSEPLDTDLEGLKPRLAEIFAELVKASHGLRLSLGHAASVNLKKIDSRWPAERVYPPLFDEHMPEDEQLPRRIEMVFRELQRDGKHYVVQKCRGIIIGDQLTDNKMEPDDYRFHDVFHLAYVAHLGWSPVLRALFRVKRKSNAELDENEDGARAMLIEEGISTWIFNHAHHHRGLFEGVEKLDYDLLKSVQQFFEGYEVQDCALWQWEIAILQGFEVFRLMKHHRKGTVVADMEQHTIEFKEIK